MRCIFSLLSLMLSTQLCAKTPVYLYTYFDKPPFIISQSQKSGLSYDLAEALNNFSTKYDYQVIYAPKQRALNEIASNGALLWVNPAWVNDKAQTKYFWLNNLINDRELYITNETNVTFIDESSLVNKTLVSVRGYSYFKLDKYIRDKLIKRTDVRSENLIPKMLLKRRADFGVLGFQTYYYLVRQHPEYLINLHIIENYKNYFSRGILVSKAAPDIKAELDTFIQTKAWDNLFNKWLTVMP